MAAIKYNTKAIVTVPAWAQALHDGTTGQSDTINTAAAAYAFVPLIYRAIRLRADALVRVPVHFTKLDGETEVEFPFPEIDFKDILWKTEAALDLQGVNYIEKIPRKMSKKTGALAWVNPITMTTQLVKKDDGSIDYIHRQGTATNGTGTTWTPDEMIYMREFSLQGYVIKNGNLLPGDSPTSVSLNDAALLRYMSRFAARFFETGAMPITVLQIDGIVDPDEAKRIEGFFKRAATRIRNAFNVLALGRAIEPKIISQPLKDLVMPELHQQAARSVAQAFGIPVTMLEDAANFATADSHRMSFWQDTIQPRGEWLAEQFNRQLFNKMGIQMQFAFEEMDIFQEDENARAVSLKTLVDAGMKLEVALSVLGYDLSEEEMQLQFPPEPEQPVTPPPTEQVPVVTETPAPKSAWSDDLSRWERKALRVLKENSSAVCSFESENIPADLRNQIETKLPTCKTADDVRSLFGARHETTETPAPEYKSDPGLKALADSINVLAAEYSKSLLVAHPQPQPNINVTLPPITMTANLPEQKETSITFAPVIEAKAAEQPAPQVIVNVPEQAAPVVQNTVNVDVPEQAAPIVQNEVTVQPAEVKVDMPKPKRERQKIKRNKQNGLIESTDTTIEYEE